MKNGRLKLKSKHHSVTRYVYLTYIMERFRDMIMHAVVNNITGPKNYLIKNRATYIVTTLAIDGANLIPRNRTSIAKQLQQVIHDVGK